MNDTISIERKRALELFCFSVKTSMIRDGLSAKDLRENLTEKMKFIESHYEKLFLLRKILNLESDHNNVRDITIIYLGGIQSYFSFVRERLYDEEYLINKEINKDSFTFPEFKKKRRTLEDIALQLYWQRVTVTNENKDQIAGSFPDLRLKNGSRLKLNYDKIRYKTNRINDQDDDKKNRRFLVKMETALKYLTDPDHIKIAEEEILTFKQQVKKNRDIIL